MIVNISSNAEEDIADGFWFFERQSIGLGDYFRSSIVADIDSLAIYQTWIVTGWDGNDDGIADGATPPGFIADDNPVPTKRYSYDQQGRLATVSLPAVMNPENSTIQRPVYQYGYDAFGNQDVIIDPLGHETRFTFDDSGRQESRVLPLGYGDDGKLGGAIADPADPITAFGEQFEYDELGRQYLHISFEGVVTESIYDDADDPVAPTNQATGRLIERRYYADITAYNAGTHSESWNYQYDQFGRQIVAEHSVVGIGVTRTESNTYDDDGRLWVVDTPEGILEYQYDDDGRKTSTSVRSAGGALSSPPERVASYTYDGFGRLKTVTEDLTPTDSSDATLDTTYRYNATGSLGRTELPNGIVETFTYDTLGRLDLLANTDANGNMTAQYDYEVRADGKRTGLEETVWFDLNSDGIQTADELKTSDYDWTYDDVGRLTDEVIDHWDDTTGLDQSESFTYDLTGNRVRLDRTRGNSAIDEAITYLYDANDRLEFEWLDHDADADTDQTTAYDYDHTQQTEKTVYGGDVDENTDPQDMPPKLARHVFGYNLQGRMSSVINEGYDGSGVLNSRSRTSYEYDNKSFRISLVNDTDTNLDGTFNQHDSTVEFLADHRNFTGYAQTIRETKVENGHTLVTDYTFGHDEIAQRTHGVNKDGNAVDVTHVFGHDGHGSVRVLYDLAGAIAQAYTFAAYGNMLAVHDAGGVFVSGGQAAALTSLGYSGEHFDAKAQQQYLRARFYDPANGRFNRLDPFAGNMQDPQSLHKYSYVHGDPVQLIDPTGMFGVASTMSASAIATQISQAQFDLGVEVLRSVDPDNALVTAYDRAQFAMLAAAIASGGVFGALWLLQRAQSVSRPLLRNSINARDSMLAALVRPVGRQKFKTLDEFKTNSGLIFKSGNPEKEAEKAFELYQRAANSKGIVLGVGDGAIEEATDGWDAQLMLEPIISHGNSIEDAVLHTPEINWAWIDGAVDAGKPVLVHLPEGMSVTQIDPTSTLAKEIQRVLSRGGRIVFSK